MADVSIVIRAYNEAAELRRALESVKAQVFDGQMELVVVDNGSTDNTAAVAREFGAAVVTLPQQEFSYPKSLNVGIERATAPIVICLVAHAYPDRRDWVAAGARHFADPRVAGVFSFTKPLPDATVWDRLLSWPAYLWCRLRGAVKIRRVGPGTFGATNIALRRELWQRHPFDEAYGAGGEDTGWAKWAISQGYVLVRDPAFSVRHSHNLGSYKQLRQQLQLWKRTEQPRRFDQTELSFRKRPNK